MRGDMRLVWIAVTLAVVLAAGCARPEPEQEALIAPEVFTLGAGNAIVFHAETDRPIHLGDHSGRIQDIPLAARGGDKPPKEAGWRFRLKARPASAVVEVAVYSVAAPRDLCATLVRLNDHDIADLSQLPGAGSGQTTRASLPLDVAQLSTGENTLSIVEQPCRGRGRPIWNDSLVKAAAIRLAYP